MLKTIEIFDDAMTSSKGLEYYAMDEVGYTLQRKEADKTRKV